MQAARALAARDASITAQRTAQAQRKPFLKRAVAFGSSVYFWDTPKDQQAPPAGIGKKRIKTPSNMQSVPVPLKPANSAVGTSKSFGKARTMDGSRRTAPFCGPAVKVAEKPLRSVFSDNNAIKATGGATSDKEVSVINRGKSKIGRLRVKSNTGLGQPQNIERHSEIAGKVSLSADKKMHEDINSIQKESNVQAADIRVKTDVGHSERAGMLSPSVDKKVHEEIKSSQKETMISSLRILRKNVYIQTETDKSVFEAAVSAATAPLRAELDELKEFVKKMEKMHKADILNLTQMINDLVKSTASQSNEVSMIATAAEVHLEGFEIDLNDASLLASRTLRAIGGIIAQADTPTLPFDDIFSTPTKKVNGQSFLKLTHYTPILPRAYDIFPMAMPTVRRSVSTIFMKHDGSHGAKKLQNAMFAVTPMKPRSAPIPTAPLVSRIVTPMKPRSAPIPTAPLVSRIVTPMKPRSAPIPTAHLVSRIVTPMKPRSAPIPTAPLVSRIPLVRRQNPAT
ncbi:hypothetical protein BC829DRAFT_441712 [Chytridium lagenaria]|nr:hypothetical protein BC829DRAFT_441712 [Chytridium lagenaria]